MLSCRGESVLWLFVNNGERWCWSHNRVLPRTVGRGGGGIGHTPGWIQQRPRLVQAINQPGWIQWRLGGYRPYTGLDTAEAERGDQG